MKFVGDSGQAITSPSEWQEHGAPASPKDWKPGRSAYETMRAWLTEEAAEQVEALLRGVPGLEDLELERATVEKKTRFDDYRSGPRNHDLLAVGRAAGDAVVVAVEAKADEPFDVTLAEYVARARGARSNAPARLDALTLAFLDTTLEADASLGPLRYQLFAALAGAMADAKLAGAGRLVLLVHEFDTPLTRHEKQKRNLADLEAFLDRITPATERQGTDTAWWRGPVTVRGAGERMPESAEVVFAKLRTTRDRIEPAG